MVLWCKRIHKPGRKFSGFSQIFMELCTCKVELGSPHRNSINGLVQRKPKQREGESHFTLENSGEKKLHPWIFDRLALRSFTLNTKVRKNNTHWLLKFHMIFLSIPGNSTSFLLEPWNFLPFLQYSCKFHVFDPPFWIFSEIVQWLC